eukprot:403373045
MDMDSNSNIYVVGTVYHNTRSAYYKLSADSTSYPFAYEFATYDSNGLGIKVSPDQSAFYVSGWSNNYPFSFNSVSLQDRDSYLFKSNINTGAVIWVKLFGDTNANDEPRDITVTQDSKFIFVIGYTSYSSRGSNDVYLLKIAADGSLVEQLLWGGPNEDVGMNIKATEDNKYLYLGFYSSTDSDGDTDIGLIKFEYATKQTTWQARFGGPRQEIIERISVNPINQNVLIAGYGFPPSGNRVALAVYVSGEGYQMWARSFAGSSQDDYARGSAIQRDGTHGFITGAYRSTGYSSNPNYWNGFIIKIDLSTGLLVKEKQYTNNLHSETPEVFVSLKDKTIVTLSYYSGSPYGYNSGGSSYNNGVHLKMTNSLDDLQCIPTITGHSLNTIYSDWSYGMYGDYIDFYSPTNLLTYQDRTSQPEIYSIYSASPMSNSCTQNTIIAPTYNDVVYQVGTKYTFSLIDFCNTATGLNVGIDSVGLDSNINSMPPGLSYNSAFKRIEGTPTTVGIYGMRTQITVSGYTYTSSFIITVVQGGKIITSSNSFQLTPNLLHLIILVQQFSPQKYQLNQRQLTIQGPLNILNTLHLL